MGMMDDPAGGQQTTQGKPKQPAVSPPAANVQSGGGMMADPPGGDSGGAAPPPAQPGAGWGISGWGGDITMPQPVQDWANVAGNEASMASIPALRAQAEAAR